MNTLTIFKDYIWKLLLLILVGATIGLIVARENVLFLGVLVGLAFFILLVRRPELSLAILFNGILIYFYLIYKLDIESSRLLTGGFYAFLSLSYLLGGVLLNARRPYKFRLSSVDVLFIFFFLWAFLSYFIFYTEDNLAYKKITYAPLLVIVPYFGIQLLSSEERIKKFFKYCVLVAAILIIPSLYELIFNPILTEATGFSIYLIKDKEANHILFGITFAILLLIIFIKIYERKENKFKYLILIIPSAYLLLRSGSRGALISLVITVVFYLLFITTMRLKRWVYLLVFLALLIFGVYKLIPESTVVSYQYIFTPEARVEEGSSLYQRITVWKQAINEFKENPILGVGFGNSVGGGGFPHNILLETSAELGILGLFMLLSMCYLTIKKAMTFIKKEEDKNFNLLMKLSLLLFIYSLTEAMVSGYITNQIQLFMSMGLIASLMKLKQNKDSLQGDKSRFKHERATAL
jgi:O-antigen ligase